MKRLLLFLLAFSLTSLAFGQKAEDKSFGIGLDFTTGMNKYQGDSYWIPEDTGANVMLEYGYFASNHLRFSIAGGILYTSSPSRDGEKDWLNTRSICAVLNPGISYYFRITDRFFYTPEVGYAFSVGGYSQELSHAEKVKALRMIHSFYLNALAFECKLDDKWSVSFTGGALNWSRHKYSFNDSLYPDAHYDTFGFSLQGGMAVRHYF